MKKIFFILLFSLQALAQAPSPASKLNSTKSEETEPMALITPPELLMFSGESAQVNGVEIFKQGHLNHKDKGVELKLVGSGLRSKKVVFVNVKVYVAQIYSEASANVDKTKALESLSASPASVIRLHFLRNVEGEKVQSSFKEALEANKVDINSTSLKDFLNAVKNSGEAKEGKAMTIALIKNADGTESIIYKNTNSPQTEIKATAGTAKNILSIWLGTPADDQLAELKKEILR